MAGYAVPRGVGQIAAVCIQSRSPGDLPSLVSCLFQTSIDFVDHLLLGRLTVLCRSMSEPVLAFGEWVRAHLGELLMFNSGGASGFFDVGNGTVAAGRGAVMVNI